MRQRQKLSIALPGRQISEECHVYMVHPGLTRFTTAGRLEIDQEGDGIAQGRFVYCRNYIDSPGAVPIDPVGLDELSDKGTDGVVAPLPPGMVPNVGDRFGRIMTRKSSNVNADDVATMRPRSSIREKENRAGPAGLKGICICAYHPGTATSGAATADAAKQRRRNRYEVPIPERRRHSGDRSREDRLPGLRL